MITGQHNADFHKDFLSKSGQTDVEEQFQHETDKADFFALIKGHDSIIRYDEPVKEELIIEDKLLNKNLYIEFTPDFHSIHSENYMTGAPEVDNGNTEIELHEVYFSKNDNEPSLDIEDFTATELHSIKQFIISLCG